MTNSESSSGQELRSRKAVMQVERGKWMNDELMNVYSLPTVFLYKQKQVHQVYRCVPLNDDNA